MRLNKRNLTPYLLDKGFLDYSSVISGDVKISQTQSRNTIFKVYKGKSNGLFVKQLNNMDDQNSYLLQKDAASMHLISHNPLYKETQSFLPQYFGYDTRLQVLVTEFVANAKNLHEITLDKKKFSLEHADEMAKILSSFHFDISQEVKNIKALQFYSQLVPWALQMHQKMDWPSNYKTGVGGKINDIVTSNAKFQKMLLETAELWEATSLIHGDIKWLNFINSEVDGKSSTKLIDWEIADIGDPLWDVAGVLQSYLTVWVVSYENNLNYEKKLPGNEYMNLENSKPATKRFWESYTKHRGFGEDESYKALIKCIKYTAARLIQTAFESNAMQSTVLPNSLRMLQLSYHLLENPEQTGEQLLGLK